MAEAPVVRVINRENIEDAPDWITKILQPLNLIIESLTHALQNKITFRENIAADIREIRFKTTANYESSQEFETIKFQNNLGSAIQGVWVAQSEIVQDNYMPITGSIGIPQWRELENAVRIEYIPGLEDSTTYKIKLFVVI